MRVWLRRWQPYAAALLAFAVFSPVLLWNAAHGWASFEKQGGRAGDWQPTRALQFLGELIGGQLGLATPLVAVICGAGLVLAVRKAWQRDAAWTLLAGFTALPALILVQHALGDRVQANWPAILYPAAAIAATGLGRRWQGLFAPAAILGLALTAAVWIQAIAAPLALPMMQDPTLLRLGGWQQLATEIDATARAQGARFIAVDNYGIAALIARLAPQGDVILGAEPRWSLFALPDASAAIDGQPGLLVRSARRDDHPDPSRWAEITPLAGLTRARNGMTAESFRLYRVVGRPGDATIVVLPRPQE
jgi:hypothetical protein